MSMTRAEQEAGIAVVRKWPRDEVLSVARLPTVERDLILLAAALLDIAPGAPVTNDVLEIKIG